jgi:hypothetical protein
MIFKIGTLANMARKIDSMIILFRVPKGNPQIIQIFKIQKI